MTEERWVKLSYDYSMTGPIPPGLPAPQMRSWFSLEKGDIANVSVVEFCNHSGSHVDAPRHVIPDGLRITEFAIEDFIYTRPFVLSLRLEDCELLRPRHFQPHAARLAEADLFMLEFGFAGYRLSDVERYRLRNPGFSVEAAGYLRENFPNLTGVAMDTISLAAIACVEEGMEAHRVLLGGKGRKFVIYEDLRILPEHRALKRVVGSPWLIEGVDSAPCTVLGVL